MQIWHLATWTALAAGLTAQESAPGFKWVGVRAGSMSFDPQEYVKAAPILGGQAGMVFDGQRYGLSLEVLSSRPESSLVLNKKVNHSLVSATWMSGLSADASSRFWPYFGVGLGGATVVKIAHPTKTITSSMSPEAHASLGFLHRPLRGLIWGAEGRYLVTFSNPGMNEYHGSVLLGLSWGGYRAVRRSEAPSPPPPILVPVPAPPPPPVPVVEVAPPPPPPVAQPRPSQKPIFVVEAAPPPAPPAVIPAPPVPAPPPPAPVSAPLPITSNQTDSTRSERLDALRREDISRVLELGRRRLQAIPISHWTVRLEVANLTSTLKSAVGAFPTGEPDLFVAPIQLQGGKTAYQLFLGEYPTKAAAERAAKVVPPFFLEGGNRPKAVPIAGIPLKAKR